jgi:hypothetical protein
MLPHFQFTGNAFDAEDTAEAEDAVKSNSSVGLRRKAAKKVVGFGRQAAELYGLGERFDMEGEFNAENVRFEDNVSEDLLPSIIRDQKSRRPKQWIIAPAADPVRLEARAKKVNRQRLNYAGMSEGGGF